MGELLTRRSYREKRQSIDYAAKASTCKQRSLRPQCTKNAMGRTIKRHPRYEALNQTRTPCVSEPEKHDIKLLQHLMERSFVTDQRFGIKRSRRRGLWRVQIQEYLIATVKNLEKLVRYGRYNPSQCTNAMKVAYHRREQRDTPLVSIDQKQWCYSNLSSLALYLAKTVPEAAFGYQPVRTCRPF